MNSLKDSNLKMSFNNNKLLFCFIIYCLTAFMFRLVLPFGFEPDFMFRVDDILSNENSILTSFLQFFYSGYEFKRGCSVTGGVTSINFHLDTLLCGESIELKVKRWLLAVIYFSSIFLIHFLIRLNNDKKNEPDFNRKILSLYLSYLTSGVIYYTGVVAVENVAVFFSLYLVVCYSSILLSLILITIVYYIDSGSAIVLLSFYILLRFNEYYKARFKLINTINLSLVVGSLIFGMAILPLLYTVPVIGVKAYGIFNDYSTIYSDVTTKYPVFLRPIVTIMTGILTTPEGVKSILAIITVLIGLFVFINKQIKFASVCEIEYSFVLSVISTVLIFVFVLPGFANAKYYIFMTPFLLYSILRFFSFSKLMVFISFVNFLIIFQLLLFRL